MKLQKRKGNQYHLTIPVSIVEAKGWTKGQSLKFCFGAKGELIITEK